MDAAVKSYAGLREMFVFMRRQRLGLRARWLPLERPEPRQTPHLRDMLRFRQANARARGYRGH
jgi:hypothetical protein